MASRHKKRELERQCKEEYKDFARYRRSARPIKEYLARKGIQFRFYDYLDSYETEFKRVVEEELAKRASLVTVQEQSDYAFYHLEWERFAKKNRMGDLKRIQWTSIDTGEDYNCNPVKGELTGHTVALADCGGQLKTAVLLRRSIEGIATPEIGYGMKLGVLFHELGHVDDWETGTNLRSGNVSVIGAEVYAWRYSLDRLIQGDYIIPLRYLLDQLERWDGASGYKGKVLSKLKAHTIWNDAVLKSKSLWKEIMPDPTEEELLQMGAKGIELSDALQMLRG